MVVVAGRFPVSNQLVGHDGSVKVLFTIFSPIIAFDVNVSRDLSGGNCAGYLAKKMLGPTLDIRGA